MARVRRFATSGNTAQPSPPQPAVDPDPPTFVRTNDQAKCWCDAGGRYHRDGDKPAIEYADGGQAWYRHGELHREGDKPAWIIGSPGHQSFEYYKNGVLHRDDDQPAVVASGYRRWYVNGEAHRDGDKPAVERWDGLQVWMRNGKYHRGDDKPAIIYPSGSREWFRNGQLHRDHGKPAIIRANGTREWYLFGLRHRDKDNPAIIRSSGALEWWASGHRHRDGGLPAVRKADGRVEYWENGRRLKGPGVGLEGAATIADPLAQVAERLGLRSASELIDQSGSRVRIFMSSAPLDDPMSSVTLVSAPTDGTTTCLASTPTDFAPFVVTSHASLHSSPTATAKD